MPEIDPDGVINLKEGVDFKVISESVGPHPSQVTANEAAQLHQEVANDRPDNVFRRLGRKFFGKESPDAVLDRAEATITRREQKANGNLQSAMNNFERSTPRLNDDAEIENQLRELKRQTAPAD